MRCTTHIEKGRGQCILGSYQNYQNKDLSNLLTETVEEWKFVGGYVESVDL